MNKQCFHLPALFLLVSLAACSSGKKTPSGGGNARDELIQAMTAQLSANSYHAHMTSINAKGVKKDSSLDFVGPSLTHVMPNPVDGQPTDSYEMIDDGHQVFLKKPGGAWFKPSQQPRDGLMERLMVEEIKKNADITFVGMDSYNGVPMKLYQYKISSPQMKVTARVWVSPTDGLVYKEETEREYLGDEATRELYGVKVNVTAVYSGYNNSDIKIEAPAVVTGP